MQNINLKSWLTEQGATKDIFNIVLATANCGAQIANIVRKAPLKGQIGASTLVNVQGEVQQDLDIITNDIMVKALLGLSSISALVSEEIDDIIQNPLKREDANLLMCFDPLDGSSNIDTNGTIGTIFSILELATTNAQISESDIFSVTKNQQAAGYFLYGSATILMISIGKSVAMFALDDEKEEFYLVENDISIPKQSNEFAINMSYQRFWDKAISTYIEQCLLGEAGERNKRFNMRWAGSMVADVHRIFMHGGVFIYPALNKSGSENGKLRFLYEANPMAMLVEKAGGLAISNPTPIREIKATGLHQRAPVVLGSKEEVKIIAKLYD